MMRRLPAIHPVEAFNRRLRSPAIVADALTMAQELSAAALDAWQDVSGRDDLHHVVGMGADGTPTTRVDKHLDDAVLEEAARLGIGVVSEESGRRDGDLDLWAYVDPLDGSRNAGRGIPFFCTSIAVAGGEGSTLLHAASIRDLVTGQRFEAERGGGLWIDGSPAPPRDFTPDEVMVAVIADSSHADIKREHGRRGHHLRDLGSAAMELAHVAKGSLDAFIVRKAWIRSIDVAAGVLLVQEAGGICQDPAGGEVQLTFDVRKKLGIIAAHSPEALEAVQ